MALSPINYSLNAADPAQRVLQGAQFGQGLIAQAEQRGIAQDQNARAQSAEGRAAEMFPLQMQQAELGIQEAQLGLQAQRQRLEAQRAQTERAQALQDDLRGLIELGTKATEQDFLNFNLKYPEQSEATTQYFKALDENRQRPLVATLAQAATALKGGDVETGLAVATRFADAARASGDAQLADMAEATVELARANPDAAFAQIGTLLAQVDPDLAKTVLSGGAEEPSAVATLRIRAKEAGLVPGSEQYRTFMLNGGAPKKDVDLGPDVEGESKLRKEFTSLPVVKSFSEVRDAFSRIGAAAKNPDAAGDLALIFNYMKLLDPGSVVRETEFATAQNAAGVPDRIRAQYNRVLSGERLAPEQRDAFVNRAGSLFEAQKGNYDTAVADYRELASQYGYEPDRIVKVAEDDSADTTDVDATIAEQAQRYGVTPDEARFVYDVQQAARRGDQVTPEQRRRVEAIQQKMVAQ